MKRRKFFNQLGLGLAVGFSPATLLSFTPTASNIANRKVLQFGIVADVHKDLIPDANERLEKFINIALEREVDFILQLGDFCMVDPRNQDFLDIWRTFKGPRYHVLGNHDMDKNSKPEMLEYWEMPAPYYSYDEKGIHFIVLDANFLYQDGKFIDYEKANFYVNDGLRTYINEEQIEWFKADLEATKLPTIVLSHQSLWHYQWGVKNRLSLQKIMEAHQKKIICCMNGHNHIDFHHIQNGINYLEINSMSYYWMQDKYRSMDRYPKELYEQYKWLPNLATYQDPLYAFATVNPRGSMTIEGVRSQWLAPSPYEVGMPKAMLGSVCTPEISDYRLKF